MSTRFFETIESRTMLCAGAAVAPALHAAVAHVGSSLHVTPVHPLVQKITSLKSLATLSTGDFSYSYLGHTLSGHYDQTTHVFTATIIGPLINLSAAGTIDPAAKTLDATLTGKNTDLTVSGSLSGNTVSGSIKGIFLGFTVDRTGSFQI